MFDTLYELDDDGALWYTEARIATPRRSAKSTSMLVRHVHRMLRSEALCWGARPQAAATAQSAADMRDMMVNDWMPVVDAAQMPEWKRNLLSNGKEAIEWNNGGRIITFPPNGKGGHGKTLDATDLDEAFAFVDGRAETGVRHAMDTRFSPQLVISSTAGTAESTYWRAKIEDGRERVLSGEDGHVYVLEYAAGPEDDVNNPDHWPRWMPALGYTVPMKRALSEHGVLSPEEWLRAWCNGWTGASSQIIPAAAWAACHAPKTPRTGKVWMSVDASPGVGGKGRSASIAVASWRGKKIAVQVIKHGAGLDWLADAIGELTRTNTVQLLYIDTTGDIKQVLPDIRRTAMAKIEVVDVGTMGAACGRFHQGVIDGVIQHLGQPMLDAAVEGADKRTLEDQWAWKRRSSTADISPLVAATLAAWGAAVNGERGPVLMYTGA